MKKHIKNYFKHYGYTHQEEIMCELCGRPAQDLHHIVPKGMGGSKKRDNVENII